MFVFSTVTMLTVVFLAGITTQRLLRLPLSFTNAMMVGFLATLAAFHVIAYPMMWLDSSFSLLFWLYSGVLLLFVVPAIYILLQKQTRHACLQNASELGARFRKEPVVPLMTICLMAVYLFISLGYVYDCSDDCYYLPRAMEMLANNRLGIYEGLGWSGLEATSFPDAADSSTLEAWRAYWSYLYGLNPAVFSRNTLSYVIHLVSWCTAIQAYWSVSSQKNKGMSTFVFLFLYLFLVLCENNFDDTAYFRMVLYPSQGKSILVSIIHPALIYGCAQIVRCGRDQIAWSKWAMLALIFTAGIASSIIGVYWPFLCCLTMGIPYLLIERRKDLLKLLPSLILACTPVIIYAGITFLTVVTEQTRYFEAQTLGWYKAFSYGYNRNNVTLLLVCLVFVLTKGSKTAKLVLAGGCITLFATFANPLFAGVVSKYLTTGSVYFRLFWMIPICFLMAYVVTELFGSCTLKARQITALVVAGVLVLYGGIGVLRLGPKGTYYLVNETLALTQGNERRTNPYGISGFWYNTASQLLENAEEDERVRVAWFVRGECELRQYSERFELLGACRIRQWTHFDLPLEEGAVAPVVLQKDFSETNDQDFSDVTWAYEQLAASKIDYICVESSSPFAQRDDLPSGLELFMNYYGIAIYRVHY